MKCSNCSKDALFEYQITKNTSVYYCGQDLPKFLEERKKAGLLKITTAFTAAQTSALEQLSPATVEEVEPVETEPTVVKKTTKKSVK